MNVTPMATSAEELTVASLNALLQQQIPDACIESFSTLESHVYGSGQASTAGRIIIEPRYRARSPSDLPRRIMVKMARTDDEVCHNGQNQARGLYANEVAIYTRLNPSSFVEAPRALGGAYDERSQTFLLLLEDLRDRGIRFPNVTVETSMVRMHSLLAVLARLHARYWNSPAFANELSWLESHQHGEIHDLFNVPERIPAAIDYLTQSIQFKREMVQRLGMSTQALFAGFQRLQRHQAALPQTIVHGDCHIGNTYALPDDSAGLIDWQLSCRGYAVHDISYIIASALSVEMRRKHERELLAYYQDRLRQHGVTDAPDLETLWLEYRRAAVWGVYIGWLTTPVTNYGWEICVMNHLRMMTAFEDLETRRLLTAMS